MRNKNGLLQRACELAGFLRGLEFYKCCDYGASVGLEDVEARFVYDLWVGAPWMDPVCRRNFAACLEEPLFKSLLAEKPDATLKLTAFIDKQKKDFVRQFLMEFFNPIGGAIRMCDIYESQKGGLVTSGAHGYEFVSDRSYSALCDLAAQKKLWILVDYLRPKQIANLLGVQAALVKERRRQFRKRLLLAKQKGNAPDVPHEGVSWKCDSHMVLNFASDLAECSKCPV